MKHKCFIMVQRKVTVDLCRHGSTQIIKCTHRLIYPSFLCFLLRFLVYPLLVAWSCFIDLSACYVELVPRNSFSNSAQLNIFIFSSLTSLCFPYRTLNSSDCIPPHGENSVLAIQETLLLNSSSFIRLNGTILF